jgi:hypothetical protein
MVIAALLALLGIRSLARWLRTVYPATSLQEQFLYAMHAAARVALWFAFAGFFLGFALIDDPARFRWYVFVPLGLAGVQLMTGILLARTPPGPLDDSPPESR